MRRIQVIVHAKLQEGLHCALNRAKATRPETFRAPLL